jgi:hypothetical protein
MCPLGTSAMFGLSSLEDLRAARDERNVYSLSRTHIALRTECDVKQAESYKHAPPEHDNMCPPIARPMKKSESLI